MNHGSQRRQILGLVAWIVVTFVAAGIGARASISAGEFYLRLERPGWAPPPSVFGPVWSLLYLLMGVAAWLVWRVRGFQKASVTLSLFLGQLAINALWTWLFFGWRLGALSLAAILLLWALIVATLLRFWRVTAWAGALLIPYLLWVSFASALTYAVWQRNPEVLG